MKKLTKYLMASIVVLSISGSVAQSHKKAYYCINCGTPDKLCNVYDPYVQLCEDSTTLWNCCGTAIIG